MTQRELHEVYATCWRNPTVILVHPGFYGESSMQITAHHWHCHKWVGSTLRFTTNGESTWALELIDTDHVVSFVGMTPIVRHCTQAIPVWKLNVGDRFRQRHQYDGDLLEIIAKDTEIDGHFECKVVQERGEKPKMNWYVRADQMVVKEEQ